MTDERDLLLRGSFPNPRRGVVAASALAFALQWACAPKPAAQAEPTPSAASQTAAPRPVLSSNLDQLQNQYAANPAAARAKYGNVAVQFTAIAGQVATAPGQDLVIGFHTSQHPEPIRAVFTRAAAEAHAAVKTGDMVMARCDEVVEVAGKPELRRCVFRA